MFILICRRGGIRSGDIRSFRVGSLRSDKGVVLRKLVNYLFFLFGVIRRFGLNFSSFGLSFASRN